MHVSCLLFKFYYNILLGSPEDEFVEQVSLKLFVYLPKLASFEDLYILHFTINLAVSVYFDTTPFNPFYISLPAPLHGLFVYQLLQCSNMYLLIEFGRSMAGPDSLGHQLCSTAHQLR